MVRQGMCLFGQDYACLIGGTCKVALYLRSLQVEFVTAAAASSHAPKAADILQLAVVT
jgi:hypothetical protein